MSATEKLLEDCLGKRVAIHLKDDRLLVGVLRGFDDHLNLVLEEAEEQGAKKRFLGDLILRGSAMVSLGML